MQANVLHQIHQGMKVFDATRHEIGKVEWVQYGEDDPATPDAEANFVNVPVGRTLPQAISDAFRADELPEEIRQRLLMQGFVRIDADGFFAADRYVLPDQIGSISGDTMMLTVEKSELMKH